MSFLGFQKVNLLTGCLFRFLKFLSYFQNFYASVKLQRRLKLALLKKLQQSRKLDNQIFLKISLQMTFSGFRRVNLPNSRLFRFLTFLSYPSKFLCLSKALEASKVSPSAVITAEQKILQSNFTQNITSNVIFRLSEGQPAHWLYFSIFEIFMPQ